MHPARTPRPRYHIVVASALAVLGVSAQAAAQDVAGSADHGLVSRFEGSIIVRYRSAEFEEYRLVNRTMNGYRGGNQAVPNAEVIGEDNSIRLEGRLTMITYEAPANSSTLEVFRSYERALTGAGFEPVFQCSGRECAGERPPPACRLCGDYLNKFPKGIMDRAGMTLSGRVHEDQRYLAARLRRPDGDVYVSLLVLSLQQPLAQLEIVEVEPMREGLVTVDAAAMAREIEASGSVALYGIHFDTGLAEIKPESEPALEQIRALLEQRSGLQLFVVGHTDNTGSFDTNRTLSEARAQAVVDALVSRHGVDAGRLTPYGVGPLSPVAPNSSEEGRAQNRRVELVAR